MTEESLAQRLRSFRERQGLSQETLAKWLGVSRSALASYESGMRNPGISVLENMAYRLGCGVETLLTSPEGIDPTAVLLRADPGLQENEEAQDCVRRCVRIGQEVSWLEEKLAVPRASESMPSYRMQTPSSKIESIRQGERIASQERQRLGLGYTPIENVVNVLSDSGVCASLVPLSAEISGISIMQDNGFHVFVNSSHSPARQRFSLAHEFAHVLLDLKHDSRVVISQNSDANALREVRANAFAAAFLAPEEGCMRFIHACGKGKPSRVEYSSFNEHSEVSANERNIAVEQSIQLYDILLLADHFGISPETAVYRLANVRLLSEKERDGFFTSLRNGGVKRFSGVFRSPSICREDQGSSFRDRLMGLALEAFRRGLVTTGRIVEIASLADIGREEVEEAVSSLEPIG